NAVVTESVNVIHLQPVVVHGKKVIARELTIKVGALAEVAEIILRERSHERVLAVLQTRVSVEICEVNTGVAVNDIDNDCDAVPVGYLHHLLEVRSLSELFVDAEISNGKIAPVNGRSDV